MALFSVDNIIMAVIQLNKFTQFYGGCTESMANWVLSIEIASNLSESPICYSIKKVLVN